MKFHLKSSTKHILTLAHYWWGSFFIFRKLSWYDVKEDLATMNFGWFIAGAGAIILSWFFEAVVLHNMTNTDQTNVRFGSTLKITMVGLLFNNITPSSSGGQPAQLFMLFKRGSRCK